VRFETVYQTQKLIAYDLISRMKADIYTLVVALVKIGKWLHVMSRHMIDYIDNLACVQIIPLRVTVFYYAWSR
jgi:hypothetical protein